MKKEKKKCFKFLLYSDCRQGHCRPGRSNRQRHETGRPGGQSQLSEADVHRKTENDGRNEHSSELKDFIGLFVLLTNNYE